MQLNLVCVHGPNLRLHIWRLAKAGSAILQTLACTLSWKKTAKWKSPATASPSVVDLSFKMSKVLHALSSPNPPLVSLKVNRRRGADLPHLPTIKKLRVCWRTCSLFESSTVATQNCNYAWIPLPKNSFRHKKKLLIANLRYAALLIAVFSCLPSALCDITAGHGRSVSMQKNRAAISN